MRLLADENVASTVVTALRKAGHDIVDVKREQWFSKSDKELVIYASRERRIILTHDKDFLYQTKATVVLLRFYSQNPHHVAEKLVSFLRSSQSRKLKQPGIVILSEYSAEFHYPI